MVKDTCLCDVYRSSKTADLYLYVSREEGLTRVPAELLDRFGKPELALSLKLTADRQLAKEDAVRVMGNLESQGFHLQLPEVKFGRS